jgi:uncharacterized protein (DUF2141 family)
MRATIAALACAFALSGVAAVAQPAAGEQPAAGAQLPAGAQPAAGAATITVHVLGLHSVFGSVECALFAGPAGFPSKPDKAVGQAIVPIAADQTATCTFANVAPGEYAILLFHDENGNGKLDTGSMDIPTEGYGASNNPPEKYGPPKYAKAKFTVTGDKTLTIHVTYIVD